MIAVKEETSREVRKRARSGHQPSHSILIGQRDLFCSDFARITVKPIRNAARHFARAHATCGARPDREEIHDS